MARKLKTYQTSMGFFDLAIAAPSMKAALEAWGSNSNLFHQGFAKETADPRVVAATMKKPGVVLRRPVGSDKPFQEDADLPSDLPATAPRRKSEKPHTDAKKTSSRKIDDAAARNAALAFEKEQRQREGRRRKEEAAEAKKRERRNRQVARAEAELEEASQEHDARVAAIEDERAKLDERGDREETRWQKVRKRLQTAAHRARG